jgi:hypothetical protein
MGPRPPVIATAVRAPLAVGGKASASQFRMQIPKEELVERPRRRSAATAPRAAGRVRAGPPALKRLARRAWHTNTMNSYHELARVAAVAEGRALDCRRWSTDYLQVESEARRADAGIWWASSGRRGNDARHTG